MSTSQERLLDTYNGLLDASPGKWTNIAGELCYSYIDNGLTICSFLDENNINCISLYKVDNNGIIDDEIVIRKNDSEELYGKFNIIYQKLRAKVTDDKFTLLQQKVHS